MPITKDPRRSTVFYTTNTSASVLSAHTFLSNGISLQQQKPVIYDEKQQNIEAPDIHEKDVHHEEDQEPWFSHEVLIKQCKHEN